MNNVRFEIDEINFWQAASFASQNSISHYDLLLSANERGLLAIEESILFEKFLAKLQVFEAQATSQLYQDVFAELIVNHHIGPHHFLEFGATDGLSLSNTASLEQLENWSGVLAEPSPQWHFALSYNRPRAKIVKKCVWSESHKNLDFFVSAVGELSTLGEFTRSDESSVPGNTKERLKSGEMIKVETISLNDLVRGSNEGACPDYISIDTEGSEWEILSNFDFSTYRPKVLTIEHNYTASEQKLDLLLSNEGYTRVFRRATAFDAWYVENNSLELAQS